MSMFYVANMQKNKNVKDVPMKNYELLNIQACPFFYVLEQGLLSISNHYVNFAMRCGTASKGASRRRAAPKRGSSLSAWSLNGPPVELLLEWWS